MSLKGVRIALHSAVESELLLYNDWLINHCMQEFNFNNYYELHAINKN